MSGWIALKRGITKHPLFRGRPDRLLVWVWLLENAAWKPEPLDVHGEMITVQRGQLCVSLRRISDETGIGLQVIRSFFDRLRTEHQINTATTHGRTLITICNYDKYQAPSAEANTAPNTVATQRQHTNKQGNNSDYVGRAEKRPEKRDLKKECFDEGVRLLTSQGVSESAARSFIAKCIREHGEAEVLAAILAARDKAEAKSFIVRRLKPRPAQTEDDYLAAQGIPKLEVPEDEDGGGNFSRSGDSDPRRCQEPEDYLPGVFPHEAQEDRSLPFGDGRDGRRGVVLPPLRVVGGTAV